MATSIDQTQALLAPDIAAQQMMLDRRQQMADLLRQQSLTQDQGQMIGNAYVAPSWTQGLAKMAQALIASKSQDNIDAKRLDLSKQYQGKLAEQIDGPAVPGTTGPTVANAARMDANGGDATAALTPQRANPTGMTLAALLKGRAVDALGGSGASGAYWDNFKTPEAIKVNNALGITQDQALQLELAKRLKEGTQNLIPSQLNILPNGQRIVAPDFAGGTAGGFDLNGNPTMNVISGAPSAKASVAGATKMAELGAADKFAVPTPIDTVDGKVAMTPAQQRASANGGIDPAYPSEAHPTSGLDISKLSDKAILDAVKRDPLAFAKGVQANAAPKAPGIALKSDAAKKMEEQDVSYGGEIRKDIDSRVASASAQNMLLQEARDALSRFKSGGGTEVRAKLAEIAQGAGFGKETIDQIAKGDLGAVQQFQSAMAKQTLESLKSTLGSGNPIRVTEFKAFESANPHLDTDPRAMEKVMAFADKQYKNVRTEQTAFGRFKAEGNNPADFPAYWADQQSKLGFTNPTGNSQPTNKIPATATLDEIAAEIARRKGKNNGR